MSKKSIDIKRSQSIWNNLKFFKPFLLISIYKRDHKQMYMIFPINSQHIGSIRTSKDEYESMHMEVKM